ncbi:MAG: hypothetical protein ACLUJG_00750 [Lawsonibacter sp.]
MQTRSLTLTQELSQLTAGLAALEAEREATARGLEELECLRRDLAGDRDQSRALIGDYQEKNEGFAREIGEKERPASRSCARRTQEQQRAGSPN